VTGGSLLGRLSLQLRLTLLFAVAMALVLSGAGLLVHARVGASLLEQVDDQLGSRATALARDVGSGAAATRLKGSDEELAQVLDRGGRVLAASPGFGRPALTSSDRDAVAAAGRLRTGTDLVPPGSRTREQVRLLARTVPGSPDRLVVVGTALDDRAEALTGLRRQLLLAGPVALLLASAAGYLLAGAALRPVAAMRRRATAISAETSAERLPLPKARDEVHRLGESLNLMLDRLDEGLQRERRFVADASHELRTPLALLRTELDLALRRPRSPEELLATLRSVADEVDRLTRLASALLLLATGADGRLPLQRASVGVRELLDGVGRSFAARAEESGRRIEVSAPADLAVHADRLRLEQALGNLVDNALRHGAGPVRVTGVAQDGAVVLSVRDEGPGFPAGFLPHAFERFTRAGTDRPTERGSGLGLALVDAVARSHDGSVAAGNLPAGGADVELRLTRHPPPSA
jgi:heavy metal sensor kinase